MSDIAALVQSTLGMSMDEFARHLSLASCALTARVRGQLTRETKELELINDIRQILNTQNITIPELAEMSFCADNTLYKFLRRERSLSDGMYERLQKTVQICKATRKN